MLTGMILFSTDLSSRQVATPPLGRLGPTDVPPGRAEASRGQPGGEEKGRPPGYRLDRLLRRLPRQAGGADQAPIVTQGGAYDRHVTPVAVGETGLADDLAGRLKQETDRGDSWPIYPFRVIGSRRETSLLPAK
jgi:hypothetical protein